MQFDFSLLFVTFIVITCTNASRILGIFDVRSRSHYFIHQSIIHELLSRGHEVTEISQFESTKNTSNYTGIVLGNVKQDYIDSLSIEDARKLGGIWSHIKLVENKMMLCDIIFNLKHIQELIKNKQKKVDVLIAEPYYTHCFNLLAHVLDVPLVMVMPLSLNSGLDYFAGNPHNPSIIPLFFTSYTTNMNFFQRLQNSVQYAILYWYQIYFSNRNMQRVAQHCNMDLPSEEILNKRTALVMYNNHFTLINRPSSHNIINIAGMHIKAAKKLPKDLDEFINQSPHGVILFSFGSTIKASSIAEEKIKEIIHAFSNIPQKVLWRVNELNITEVPSNVKLVEWIPQRDVLEHPNIRAFISHCGLLGVIEAIHTETPIIGIPFSFDQFQNANLLVEKDVGIYVDYHKMNKDTLITAIEQILSPKYRENMQRISELFKDRPQNVLDEAMYWIEYVLKHRGALHLRTQAADMPLYQYLLLDVTLFLVVSILGVFYTISCIVKFIIRRFYDHIKRKNKIA